MDAVQIATSVLTLIAGVGIFLIACNMMSTNLEAAGSRRLKSLFAKTAKSKFLGVGVGAAATAIIQSSSATTVMVIGFVNAGIMTLAQAATVIFGANVGTTIRDNWSRWDCSAKTPFPRRSFSPRSRGSAHLSSPFPKRTARKSWAELSRASECCSRGSR